MPERNRAAGDPPANERVFLGFSGLYAHVGAPGVNAGKFTVVGWPERLLLGQGSDSFVSALKSMLVPSRISQGSWAG